jgi:hypothetical protein
MIKVEIILNGTPIAITKMTSTEIRKAEYAGFTVITK